LPTSECVFGGLDTSLITSVLEIFGFVGSQPRTCDILHYVGHPDKSSARSTRLTTGVNKLFQDVPSPLYELSNSVESHCTDESRQGRTRLCERAESIEDGVLGQGGTVYRKVLYDDPPSWYFAGATPAMKESETAP